MRKLKRKKPLGEIHVPDHITKRNRLRRRPEESFDEWWKRMGRERRPKWRVRADGGIVQSGIFRIVGRLIDGRDSTEVPADRTMSGVHTGSAGGPG